MELLMINKIGGMTLFCCIIYFSTTMSRAEEDYSSFVKEAVEVWNSYCRQIKDYGGKIDQINEWEASSGMEPQHYQYQLLGLDSWVIKEEKEDNNTVVYGVNATYSFRIKAEQDGNWAIDVLDRIKAEPIQNFFESLNNEAIASKKYNPERIILRSLAAGLDLNSSFVPVLFTDPDFEIKKIENLVEEGLNISRVHFIYRTKKLRNSVSPESGIIDLLTDYYFLIYNADIISSQANQNSTWNFRIKNKYDFSQEIPLIVSGVRQCCDLPPGKKFRYSICLTFSLHKTDKSTPYNRFTLTHYGLPEPVFENRSIRFLILRYLLFGVGILMVLYAVRNKYFKGRCEKQ